MLKSQVESILFIAGRPVSVKKMAEHLNVPQKQVTKACKELVDEYKKQERGVRLIKNESRYQLVSSPVNAEVVKDFIKEETSGELTRPSLETLTIIAYRAPVTKIEIERIRGVNCSLILRNLLIRGLVEAKTDKKKNEVYYTVSFDFLKFLGISNIEELPDYERLNRDETIEEMMSQDN
jgi:segregation and condensation protein B